MGANALRVTLALFAAGIATFFAVHSYRADKKLLKLVGTLLGFAAAILATLIVFGGGPPKQSWSLTPDQAEAIRSAIAETPVVATVSVDIICAPEPPEAESLGDQLAKAINASGSGWSAVVSVEGRTPTPAGVRVTTGRRPGREPTESDVASAATLAHALFAAGVSKKYALVAPFSGMAITGEGRKFVDPTIVVTIWPD